MGYGDYEMITGVSGATYLRVSGSSTLAGTLQDGQYILATGLAYGAVNSYTQIINGSTGAITGTTATFAGNVTLSDGALTVYESAATSPAISATSGWGGGVSNPIINFGRVGSAVAGSIGYDDPSTCLYIGTTTSHKFKFRTNNVDAITIDTSQNVGIGTNSPQRLLQLRSTNEATGIFLERTSNYGFVQYNQIVGSVETYHLGFVNNNTFSSDILVANESGSVGIGTTSPTLGKLQVAGSGYFGPVGTGDATTKAEMQSNAVLRLKPHDNNSTNMNFAQVNGGGGIGIQTTNGPGTANWDIALSPFGGKVGIGTVSPNKALTVYGGNDNGIWIDSQGAQYTSLAFGNNGTEKANIAWDNTNGYTNITTYGNGHLALATGGSISAFLNSSGNFGIGDTAPTSISINTSSLSVGSTRGDLSGGLISKANGNVKHQQYWDSSGYSFNITSNSGVFKFNGADVQVNANIKANNVDGKIYSMAASWAYVASKNDLFSFAGTEGALWEYTIKMNPNSAGSGAYRDFYYGKLGIGMGWNGSNVTQYIWQQQDQTAPRTLYGSGGGNFNPLFRMYYSGGIYTDLAYGTAWTLRIQGLSTTTYGDIFFRRLA